MPALKIHANGDNCWPELLDRINDPNQVIHLTEGAIEMARLPGGMTSGASSVTIRIDLPDGRVVLAETSLALLLGAARAFETAEARDAEDALKGRRKGAPA